MPISTLPDRAKRLWESVYQSSKKAGDKTEVAARKAWASVKGAYRKGKDGKWVKKAELVEMSMYITKASITNDTMTWAAVNSDTYKDSYQERMSLELYKDFISHIRNEDEPPSEFKSAVCSDYWCGGMPYVSISHYPDLNGKAIPGEPLEIYIDGNQLKAKGILHNNPLGHAVWRSLKEDKNKQPEDKIRISIGFLDMAHKHGESGNVFVRDSLYSICPECLQGIGEKIYVKGYLVHLALTRKPVNKRTEMVLEEKAEMAKKKITRKEDAASIVGEDLAEKLEVEQKATSQKSDVLIEMSETEEETAELIAEVEAKTEEPVEEVAEEPVEETPEVEEEVPAPVVEDAEVEKMEDDAMEAVVSEPKKFDDDYPMGGATSMKDAQEYEAAKDEMEFIMDSWSTFSTVAWNIFAREDVPDKKAALTSAVDEFRNMLAAKAMIVFSETKEEHPLKPAVDALLEAVDNSIGRSVEEKSETINPAMQDFGSAITDYIEKSAIEQPVPEDANENTLLKDIKELIQSQNEKLVALSDEVSILKSQAGAKSVETKSRIPQPRTAVVPPNLVAKSEPEIKPGSLKDIVRKSVGLS